VETFDKRKKFKAILKKNPLYIILIKKLKKYYQKKYFFYLSHDKDKAYLYLAALESLKAFLKGEIPIGCVLVSPEGKIFKAHNLKETLKKPYAHAEILAIKKACNYYKTWYLKDFKIYVTLEPCLMCFGCILESRIKHIYFGYKEKKYGFSNFINFQNFFPKIHIKNFNLSDIIIPIKIFFKLLRKR